MDSKKFINEIREIKNNNNEIFSLINGHWQVRNKITNLSKHKSSFYDSHLDLIRNVSTKVLSEIHPMFDLNQKVRFAAEIYGKSPKYSSGLQKGIAETLAFLGIYGKDLQNCTLHKAEDTVNLAIRDILNNSGWKLWASINDILPILAEAAPDTFLTSVENALKQDPCPFDELFRQEGNSITGVNYMTGLYWAMETLAWSEEYLSRAILVLAELAAHDPGGNWGNHPSNSIIAILLPWHPQTTASIEKRIAALKGIRKGFPDIAWKTIKELLPNQHKTSIENPKPKFRKYVPADWKKGVTNAEYREQIKKYAAMAVAMAKNNIHFVPELVDILDNIPPSPFDDFLEYLSSDEILRLPDEEKMPIWETLISLVRKHRCFPNAKQVIPNKKIDLLEQTAEKIRPSNPEYSKRRLFSHKNITLLEKKDDEDLETHDKNLQTRRIEALKQIYNIDKINSIIKFAHTVDDPETVGYIFSHIAVKENDVELLPAFLNFQEQYIKLFIGGYILSRYLNFGKREWVESLHANSWSNEQKCDFLLCLPFENEIWKFADEFLGEYVDTYWKKVTTFSFPDRSNLLPAIEKLLLNGRPRFALSCIYTHYYYNKVLFREQAIKALKDGVLSDEPIIGNMEIYRTREIIKKLQEDHDVDENDLFRIEWAYLSLLNGDNNAKPKLLEKYLSQKPDFFHEIIQLVYRSKMKKGKKEKIDKKTIHLTKNAYKLLANWKHPPGKMDDGSFSVEALKKWFDEVKVKTTASGYFESAMLRLGHVLFYAGADSNGLWIQQPVAEMLNDIDEKYIIQGFTLEVFNSRGLHYVDTSGKDERERADLWRKRADEVENLGLIKFAASIRDLAHSYDREAERTISTYLAEQEE